MIHFYLQYCDAAIDKDLVSTFRLGYTTTEDVLAATLGDLMAARIGHRVVPADVGVAKERERERDEVKKYDPALAAINDSCTGPPIYDIRAKSKCG